MAHAWAAKVSEGTYTLMELVASMAEEVFDLLGGYRFRGMDEYDIQAAVADVLVAAGLPFEREVRLSPRDRVDFLLRERLGVEVKVQGSPAAHLRQLGRYAATGKVGGLVLASTRAALLRSVPPAVHGVPVWGLRLRGAVL